MTLDDAQLVRHDALAQAFLRQLRTLVPTSAFEEVEAHPHGRDPVLVVRIPAASPAVGDVLVHSDGNELTTQVGDHTHRHTGVYLFGDAVDPVAIDAAACSDAEWVRDLIADEIIIWSRRVEGDVVVAGGAVADGDDRTAYHRLMRVLATEAWYWSGRPFPLPQRKGTA